MSIQPAKFHLPDRTNQAWQPERVLLFSGHMIDAPRRTAPRFPPEKAGLAVQCIAEKLDEFHAGQGDLAITQGANGGDILFAEACLQRNVKLQLLQPFAEAEFIENSVTPGNADWLPRYQNIARQLSGPPLAAPAELGPLPPNMNAYERCNLWLLASGLAYGPEKLVFICLWDGGGGDGPGGTAHMVAEVQKQHGRVIWLDTRTLW
ncbi:hypothetical protein [Methylomonas methanica]|uniref:Tetratricopeptide TPR_2 repeat protein n=1 Tax=Methylomonas methanica (strain DSM 25384 / MC09) TaxID=857087 RepID=G0A0R5_METMM|nr:hypothetical protein [Methylomonas methanica]AEF99999.1 tetratricopeptide TPR_2 repeat protein [Methylomonas methanica MC09]